MIGPGRVDHVCTQVLEATGAQGVFLVIIGGTDGGGVSAKLQREAQLIMPKMLRAIADEMERDNEKLMREDEP